MRVAPAALVFFGDRSAVVDGARLVAEITHAHSLALDGAIMIALAVAAASGGATTDGIIESVLREPYANEHADRLAIAADMLSSPNGRTPNEVRKALGNGVRATHSCSTAVWLALTFLDRDFSQLVGFAKKLGGDTDTIASMAAAIWGASRGEEAIPKSESAKTEATDSVLQAADQLASVAMQSSN